MTPHGSLRAFRGGDPDRRPIRTRGERVSTLLLLTNALLPSSEVLPALGLLSHQVRVLPAEAHRPARRPAVRRDPRRRPPRPARRPQLHAGCCAPPASTSRCCWSRPRAAWSASPPSGASTTSCSRPPARPRSTPGCASRSGASRARVDDDVPDEIRSGDVTHRRGHLHRRASRGRVLDLTFKEFELLKFLAQHPGRVFTPRPAAAGGLGLRLLRRHPHGRRPRPPAARQARPRARGAHRHRAQRRLPVRR